MLRWRWALVSLFIIASSSSSFADDCSVKEFLATRVFRQESREVKSFNSERFRELKEAYAKEAPSQLPATFEERAALFESLLPLQSEPGFSVEAIMVNGSKSDRKDLDRSFKKIFSKKAQTDFKLQTRIEDLYQTQMIKADPGYFKTIDASLVRSQIEEMVETRITANNVSKVLTEMGVIRNPNAFQSFVASIQKRKDLRRLIDIPEPYFEIAMNEGFDAAWNAGLEKALFKQYGSAVKKNIVYRRGLKAFQKTVNTLSTTYGLLTTAKITYDKVKQIQFLDDVEDFQKAHPKTEVKDLSHIPSKIEPAIADQMWKDWVQKHPEAARDPSSKKYKAAHRVIFGN